MNSPCTQNIDRECREEDCCLKNLDKLLPEIKCRCQNCDAKFSRYGKLEGIYVCHCGFEQDVSYCKEHIALAVCCECNTEIFRISGHFIETMPSRTLCFDCYRELKRYEYLYVENSKGK